jgi:DUF1009 family protein
MCGAGVLPARMAREARRQGWRVIAFAFADAPELEAHAHRVVPSQVAALDPVLAALARERVSAALFAGKLRVGDILQATPADAATRALEAGAGSLGERRLADTVVATLGGLGIEVLDQRAFVGDGLAAAGCSTSRQPTDAAWDDVRRGLDLARRCAEAGIGQTVVLRRGVVAAVEALEGTTEAVQRGAALAGPGTVVVKAVAPDNDYRFDTPTIGPETIAAAAAGQVAVVAVEARRVLLLERDTIIALAERGGIALVGVDDS